MARSLAERLRAHEQQKAKLAEQEAKLKDAERRARTLRLIEAGGLVDKVGLLDLDSNALYGALLSLRDGAISPWSKTSAPYYLQTVTAVVPLSEVTTYARSLSSITGGQGSYTMEFSRYEVVPGNVHRILGRHSTRL